MSRVRRAAARISGKALGRAGSAGEDVLHTGEMEEPQPRNASSTTLPGSLRREIPAAARGQPLAHSGLLGPDSGLSTAPGRAGAALGLFPSRGSAAGGVSLGPSAPEALKLALPGTITAAEHVLQLSQREQGARLADRAWGGGASFVQTLRCPRWTGRDKAYHQRPPQPQG